MRKKTGILAVCLLLSLTGCGNRKSSGESTDFEEIASSATEETVEEAAAKAYNDILEGYESGELTDNGSDTVSYSLASVASHCVPLLLINEDAEEGISEIHIYAYDEETNTVESPKDFVMIGVSGVGGFRGEIGIAEEGPYLQYTTISSGTGDTRVEKLDVVNGELSETTVWEGKLDEIPSEFSESATTIEWYELTERTHLDTVSLRMQTVPEKTEESSDGLMDLVKEKQDAGMLVMEGKIYQLDHDGVLALQGIDDPNPGYEDTQTYVIFVLSESQDLDLKSCGGGSFMGTVDMICLFDFAGEIPSEDKTVYVSFDPEYTYWPSDTRLPLCEPGSSAYEILN